MYEQDYIMRLIKEMVRSLLKLLFHIDMQSPIEELLHDREARDTLRDLAGMVDRGKINEAENRLYALAEAAGDGMAEGAAAETEAPAGTQDRAQLELALLFYGYLNEKDDEFLDAHGYSREEIRSGIQDWVERYGLKGMAEAFLEDEE